VLDMISCHGGGEGREGGTWYLQCFASLSRV